jgi:hypothetical protein
VIAMPHELIDAVKVRKEMNGMIKMITHPAFVEAMRQLKATPVSKRREVGKRLLTVESLRKQGAPIPAGMRLTTRYFEQGKPTVIELPPDGRIVTRKIPDLRNRVLDPTNVTGWGGCACGGLSFCGGAGGGT